MSNYTPSPDDSCTSPALLLSTFLGIHFQRQLSNTTLLCNRFSVDLVVGITTAFGMITGMIAGITRMITSSLVLRVFDTLIAYNIDGRV